MNSLRPVRWQRLALPLMRRTVRASPSASSLASPPVSWTPAASMTTRKTGAMRLLHTETKTAEEKPTTSKSPEEEGPLDENALEPVSRPGHGERIWVFYHVVEHLIVYSLTPQIDATKARRQFAYTGKKLVPAKFRKDYWRPFVVMDFGPGNGDVGRSAFQKLREFKRRHELEWSDHGPDAERLRNMSRRERGKALNDQRPNGIADMAAVLAGAGKGNRVAVARPDGPRMQTPAAQAQTETETGARTNSPALSEVTVYWANEQDRYYAMSWSDNVSHVVGLPETPSLKSAEATSEPKAEEAKPPAAGEGAPAAAAEAS